MGRFQPNANIFRLTTIEKYSIDCFLMCTLKRVAKGYVLKVPLEGAFYLERGLTSRCKILIKGTKRALLRVPKKQQGKEFSTI